MFDRDEEIIVIEMVLYIEVASTLQGSKDSPAIYVFGSIFWCVGRAVHYELGGEGFVILFTTLSRKYCRKALTVPASRRHG